MSAGDREDAPPLARRFEHENVHAMRSALDRHNLCCCVPASAFALNPVDHGLLGFDELWGLPVIPDAGVAMRRFELRCEASTVRIEDELAALSRPATDTR